MKTHCPQLSKDEWHLSKHIWDKRPFYQVHYRCFFNLPINLQTQVRQALTKLQNRDLLEETPMIFSVRENAWGGDLLISITKHVPDLETRSISGHFISFLFNGNYKQVPYWIRKVQEYGRRKYLDFSELYIWHVTCPRCIQKYGQAQTVIFAKML
jgi:hypothetical protein